MNVSAPPVANVRTRRDHRLDVLRGLALITIFINHVPDSVYEDWTSRNFGFSDAAEGFVLMSGIATGLAYAGGFQPGRAFEAAMRVWRRARKLYLVHLLITGLALAILSLGLFAFGTEELSGRVNYIAIVERPLETILVGLPTLGHQFAYFNILPLYCVLLLVAPAFILIGRRSIWAMIGVSALVWAAAGMFRLNLPNFPNEGGWFFNPLAWQLVFVIGVAGGMRAREGRSLVPANPLLFVADLAFLVFSGIWVVAEAGGLPGGAYVPFFIGGFDKSFLPLPRLLHVLALAYVLVNMRWLDRLLGSWPLGPVDTLGRNSLPVFATGSVIAIALQVVGEVVPTDALVDGLFFAAGLVVQYGVALLAMAGGRTAAPLHAARAVASAN